MNDSIDRYTELTARIDRIVSELMLIRREVADLGATETPAVSEEQETIVTAPLEEVQPEEPASEVSEPIEPDTPKLEEMEEKVPELTLETAFEPMMVFRTSGSLSVADSFFYANELFGGNRAELETALTEIDRLSSVSQLRHYLADTLQLDLEREEVQRFYDFVIAHSTHK